MDNRDFLKSHLPLILSIGFSTLALIGDVPGWTALSALVFWLWKLLTFYLKTAAPSKKLTGFFALIFFVLIYLEFKTYLGKESATSFIIILAALKILEFTEEIEKDFIVLLGFFLTTAKFLFSYDLFFLSFSIPIYFILTMSLLPNSWTQKNSKLAIKYVLKVFTGALPISILIFFLFPRVTKTLTELNIAGSQGISGFSDNISPGSISDLSLSNELVMRIEMNNIHILKVKEMYIKGLVLEKNINQMNWGSSKIQNLKPTQTLNDNNDYKITLEQTNRLILFSLYNTLALNTDSHRVFVDSNNTFRTDSVIERRIAYKGYLGAKEPTPTNESIQLNLETDRMKFTNEPLKSKLFDLIKEIKSKYHRRYDINNAILAFFKNNNFQYTLSPGLQANLGLDVFLFQSKKGYCEHFAAAHASLLRLAGIPARVIIGYQGGEYNPVGNFWTIRQKDAHAWVEYLTEGHNWILTDPINVIAPQRIEFGSELFSSITSDLLTAQEIESKVKTKNLINSITMWFENINYQWNSFLLDFDFEKQKELFQKYKVSVTFVVTFLLIFLATLSIVVQKFSKAKVKISTSTLSFYLVQNWAKKYNLEKEDFEGPVQWKERILKSPISKDKDKIVELLDSWMKISYENLDENTKNQEFAKLKTVAKALTKSP